MRIKIISLLIFSLLILSSCQYTSGFVAEPFNDPDISMEEKMKAANVDATMLDIPETYFDAEEFLQEYIDIVNNTKDYLLISTFLGSYSDSIDDLYQAIMNKAKEGVRVYFIIDAVSSMDMTDSKDYMTPLYFLRDAGVNLVEYNPLSGLRLIAPQTLVIRDHRKIIVSDGKVSIIGGMNMNYISLGAGGNDYQRDSMFVFHSGEFASKLIDEFIVAWNSASIHKIKKEDFKTHLEDGLDKPLTAYVFNQGPNSEHKISELFGSVISSAKEEIVFMPYLPYFDANMNKSIKDAIERGVKVKMYFLFDSREYMEKSLNYVIEDLVDLGMEIYYTRGGEGYSVLHEKLMVVDGKYTVIGSSNFNYRSMGLSHEVSILIDGEEFASEAATHLNELTKNYVLLDKEQAEEWGKDGNLLFYLFSYIGG